MIRSRKYDSQAEFVKYCLDGDRLAAFCSGFRYLESSG